MARKLALVTCDNYPGVQGAELQGCVNDGRHMADVLTQRGFEVTTLFNEQDTRAAILEALGRLVTELGPDDIGVWHRSSHGTQGAVHGDPTEPDQRQEGIVPYDFRTAGIIWDDTLRDLLGQTHRRARMVVLMDTCFSGGVDRAAGQLGDYYRRARYLPPAVWLRPEDTPGGMDRALASVRAVTAQPVQKAYPVLLLSACQAFEVAYCTEIDGEPQGAFSYAARRTLADDPKDYRAWLHGIRGLLPSADSPQTPLLIGSPGRVRWPTLEP